MGYNTVAILYNDHIDRIRKDGERIGSRMADSMVGWSVRERYPGVLHFGAGVVVSQAHADYPQVVIVHRNTGAIAAEAEGLDWYALDQMRDCLERHGYRVTKRRKPRVSDRSAKRQDAPAA